MPLEAAREAERVIQSTLSNNVDKDVQQKVFMQEGEAAARGLRDAIKAKVVELELERAQALTHLAEQIEEELAPKGATPSDIIAASGLTEERVIQAADACAAMPEEQADLTLRVLLASARAQNYDQAVWHCAELLGPETEMALADLDVCAEEVAPSIEDLEAQHEAQIKEAPSGMAILAAAKEDINLLSSLR